MRNIIIINEQHNLLPQQKEIIIRELGGEIELKKIPSEGLSRQQIEGLVEELSKLDTVNIIVLSPIPLLLGRLAHKAGELDGRYDWMCLRSHIYILHNDKREKVELPNGTVRSVISKEGWELIGI